MELIGNLKKKVDKASSKEEKRELIEKAGMKLNDMELEMISGGNCDDALLYQKLYIQGEPGGKRGLCPKPRMSY